MPPLLNRHAVWLLLLTATSLAQIPSPPPAEAPAPAISKKQQRAADNAYLAGARQLDRNDPVAAEISFAQAARLNPTNNDYPLALAVAREHQVTQLVHEAGKQRALGNNAQADALIAQAAKLDPQNPIVAQHLNHTTDEVAIPSWQSPPIPQLAGAIELHPKPITQNFHLRTDTQTLVRLVAEPYGIHCIFDPSVTHQDVRLDLDNTPYTQVMPIVLMMTHLFAIPLDPTTLLLVSDTEANRQQFQPQLLETLNIPGQTSEQLNELVSLIRNVFDVKQATVDSTLGDIVLRAPEDTLRAINLTLGDMLDGGSQLMLDIKLYEVDTTRSINLGAQVPQSIGAYNVPAVAESAIAANQSIINQAIASGLLVLNGNSIQNLIKEALFLAAAGLLNSNQVTNTLGFFGGGITTSGVSLGSGLTANFALNSSESRVLDDIQLRVFDRADAVFRTGTRYPITTSTYTSSVTTLPSSLAGATINGVSVASLLSSSAATSIPQIQYEDLGLTLKTTPTIQKTGSLITLKLDLKIEALTGSTLNNIPVPRQPPTHLLGYGCRRRHCGSRQQHEPL